MACRCDDMHGMSGPIYAEQYGKNISHVGSAVFELSFFLSCVFLYVPWSQWGLWDFCHFLCWHGQLSLKFQGFVRMALSCSPPKLNVPGGEDMARGRSGSESGARHRNLMASLCLLDILLWVLVVLLCHACCFPSMCHAPVSYIWHLEKRSKL